MNPVSRLERTSLVWSGRSRGGWGSVLGTPVPGPSRRGSEYGTPATRAIAPHVWLALLLGLPLNATADESGTIAGTLDAPATVAAVVAIDRATDAKFPGVIAAATGRFTIANLPLGRSYDCLVDYRNGAKIEGINLKVPRSDYEEEQPLAAEDAATIKDQVKALNKFEDVVDVLAVAGNVQHAAVLVNKLRVRPFVNSKPGEVVWRCELWRFERPEETWVKVQDELFLVLHRERISHDDYKKKAVTFDPALGGLSPSKAGPTIDLGSVKQPDPAPGVRFRSNHPQ